jgi:hypothetical protein
MPKEVLYPLLVLLYAIFWAGLGYWVGCRVTTRRHLPALLYAAKKPTPAHLGNTVARSANRSVPDPVDPV